VIAGLFAAVACCAWSQDASKGWPGPATPVRWAPERDYGPFVFERADGTVDGLSVELLQLIARGVQLPLQALPARPLHEQLEAVRRHDADLVTSLRPTPERGAYLEFTRPYVSVPALLAMRGDRAPAALPDLAGRPVAVGQGYAVEAVVRQRYPKVDWHAVPDDVVALQGVVDGRFDAAVLDAASLAFIRRERGIDGVQAVAPVEFDYALSFAVRKDWPGLRDALDAAIGDLPAAQRQAVVARWIDPPALRGLASRAPWATVVGAGLLGLGALIAIVFGVRQRRARREVGTR